MRARSRCGLTSRRCGRVGVTVGCGVGAVEGGAYLVGVGVLQLIEDGQGVLPGGCRVSAKTNASKASDLVADTR